MKAKQLLVLLFVSFVFLLMGCKKDSAEPSNKYTITYNGHYNYATITVFEYDNSGNPIYHHNGKFYKGSAQSFTAQNSAKKVKLYVDLPFDIGWVQKVYSTSANIVIDDNTVLGGQP